jgi:amino acid permease
MTNNGKRSKYAKLQVFPIIASIVVSSVLYYGYRLRQAGSSDDGLLPLVLFLLPLTYIVLPGFFIYNIYALRKTAQSRDYERLLTVIVGLAFIVMTYWILSVTNP